MAPADGTDHHGLLKNADLALYAAKADGRGTYRFFEQSMGDRLQTRRSIESDLRSAIVHEELELFYQPLVRVGTGTVVESEALMRWRHPARGLHPTQRIHPSAETRV